jgi:hypothetical protein
MNDLQYREHCLGLLASFAALMAKQSAHTSGDDPLRELASEFELLASGADLYDIGPPLVAKLFSSCPHLAPSFPRELLWFLGGECLHYMPDEEMDLFQKLDDMRTEAEAAGTLLDYHEAHANLLKLQ